MQWFTPKPVQTVKYVADLRVGGEHSVTMLMDGKENESHGIYLEVSKPHRLVFTDAFRAGWTPSEHPFMTGIIDLKDNGHGGVLYTAIARHWSDDDKRKHEAMGFHHGWGKALDQMIDLIMERREKK
eukprot:comp8703_c0_seq3/m.9657 comp8703_c0_seq3/g.9657  ORF comp8703_c0_seq3/g.9657 comp8703_c0_seq3/m.9657 type:complete len:127 (+) comp8703_c0_seq3:56-436(+)